MQKTILLFLLTLGVVTGSAQAILLLDGQLATVQSAVTNQPSGTTIEIPAGTWSWADSLTLPNSKSIIIKGQTRIIVNKDANGYISTTPSSANVTSVNNGGQTIIQSNSSKNLIIINGGAGNYYRISGLTFQSPTISPNTHLLNFSGDSRKIRIDNCYFDMVNNIGIKADGTQAKRPKFFYIHGSTRGICDHCYFNFNGAGPSQVFYLENGNTVDNYGNGTWNEDSQFGTDDFWYAEDNYFYNNLPNPTAFNVANLSDGSYGLKLAVRHNYIRHCDIQTHGTEGDQRGSRAIEYSYNYYESMNAFPLGGARMGNLYFHHNKFSSTSVNNNGPNMSIYRAWTASVQQIGTHLGWEGASGRAPWDVNETEGADTTHTGGTEQGEYVAGHSPYQYYPRPSPFPSPAPAATVDPVLSNKNLVVDTNSNAYPSPIVWRNPFAVYQVTSAPGVVSGDNQRIVQTVNPNQIRLSDIHQFENHDFNWNSGATYQIYKCLTALDQAGRGKGELIKKDPAHTGGGDANTGHWFNADQSPTGTMIRAWPRQVVDPCYAWLNTVNGGGLLELHTDGNSPTIVANRDYYNDRGLVTSTPAPTFTQIIKGIKTGTTGSSPAPGFIGVHGTDVGKVTAASGTVNDPSPAGWANNVTAHGDGNWGVPGTAYWAPDTQSYNTASLDKGALYVWFNNQWNKWYQPFTYPHPCTSTESMACLDTSTVTPEITSTSASFVIGQAGSSQIGVRGFSPAPTSYSFNPNLPNTIPGLSISTSGLISGTVANTVIPGNYSFTVTATNGTQSDSTPFIITVTGQNTPPTISITSPSNGQDFLVGTTVNLTMNFADTGGGTVDQVQIFDGSTTLRTWSSPVPAPPLTDSRTYTAGPHILSASAKDNNNAVSSPTPSVSITISTPTPTPGTTPTPPATLIISPTSAPTP